MRLREILVAERQAAGLTQAELAKRLIRVQSDVSTFENGERRLDVVELIDVAAAIGCSATSIMDRLKPWQAAEIWVRIWR